MSLAKLLVLGAVVASVLLITNGSWRLFGMAAVVASGLEALLMFGIIQLKVPGLNIMAILAMVLAGAGVAVWFKSTDKTAVTAATALAMIGGIQLAGWFL